MTRYIPILGEFNRSEPYRLDLLKDQGGVLDISLEGEKGERITLSFDSHFAYRKTDEGDALALISELLASGLMGRSFYEVHDSGFGKWFAKESQGVREKQSLRHFLIVALDDVIDVLSLEPPKVRQNQGS